MCQSILWKYRKKILANRWRCFSHFCRFFDCKNRPLTSPCLKICQNVPWNVMQLVSKFEVQETSGKNVMIKTFRENWVIFSKILRSKNRRFSNCYKTSLGSLIGLLEVIRGHKRLYKAILEPKRHEKRLKIDSRMVDFRHLEGAKSKFKPFHVLS